MGRDKLPALFDAGDVAGFLGPHHRNVFYDGDLFPQPGRVAEDRRFHVFCHEDRKKLAGTIKKLGFEPVETALGAEGVRTEE